MKALPPGPSFLFAIPHFSHFCVLPKETPSTVCTSQKALLIIVILFQQHMSAPPPPPPPLTSAVVRSLHTLTASQSSIIDAATQIRNLPLALIPELLRSLLDIAKNQQTSCLPFLYLANEVLFAAKRDHNPQTARDWHPCVLTLLHRFPPTDESTTRRLVHFWVEQGIFAQAAADVLLAALDGQPAPSPPPPPPWAPMVTQEAMSLASDAVASATRVTASQARSTKMLPSHPADTPFRAGLIPSLVSKTGGTAYTPLKVVDVLSATKIQDAATPDARTLAALDAFYRDVADGREAYEAAAAATARDTARRREAAAWRRRTGGAAVDSNVAARGYASKARAASAAQTAARWKASQHNR